MFAESKVKETVSTVGLERDGLLTGVLLGKVHMAGGLFIHELFSTQFPLRQKSHTFPTRAAIVK
jgi:hypothetical protein